MRQWGRGIKLTAVCALVVLALTGFSTGSHGSHGSSGGSGKVGKSKSGSSRSGKSRSSSHSSGGGCSSSSQDHDDYDDDDDDVTYDDATSGATASASLQDAVAQLQSCASKTTPYATVTVTNPNAGEGTFTVTVHFMDAKSNEVHHQTDQVDVPGNDSVTVHEYVGADDLARVDHCTVENTAPAVR